ncbi:flagellar biosynthetic protein FliR [Thalassobaculum fulvum]|uniref:Flagellar biosynthetic protein FliR n=1 Tax=Thalassobaculum fulvum TaxID=1633335 RepID=A0A919CTC6_9PROT|nr:flagellar biosynthetic protein FliR [Thalassobaculum fulvum]GHD61034.1 flagellar biosynthetic protein FliR [Thalassobaculum fulvum]
MNLEEFLPLRVFEILMVFARAGSAMLMLPGIGETFVPVRVRLLLSAVLALAVAPAIAPQLPPEPTSAAGLLALIAGEVLIGIYFGLVARILLLTLDTAGRIISFSSGLASATIFNPSITEQGTAIGLILTMLGILLLFITDLHHLVIRAVVESYAVFRPGGELMFGDLSEAVTELVAGSFKVAVQLSAPFYVFSLLFFVCLGVLARLMPQLQIFFIGLPVQIYVGMLVLATILGAMMTAFLTYYADTAATYLIPN